MGHSPRQVGLFDGVSASVRTHESPPRSSLWSNQTSIPAAWSALQIRWAAAVLGGVTQEYRPGLPADAVT